MSARADLSDVATATLERLREGLVSKELRGTITRGALVNFGIKHQLDALEGALSGHSAMACQSVIEVALAERARATRPDPELVWTGPEAENATARDTAVVLRALFESAQEQVILAGFSFEKGSTVLEPLSLAMKRRPLDVRFFIHVQQAERASSNARAEADAQVEDFLRMSWPFPGKRPRIYYDKRTLVPGPPWSSLHAKCVVIDGRRAFLSSANFSVRAQEHNIEAGVLLEDPPFAMHLARQWLRLIDADLVVEYVR